ncbi:efflux RND transporter periplasmic adaptor subunit [Bacteroidota bacterium]
MKYGIILVLALLLAGCQPKQTDIHDHEAEAGGHEGASSRVTLFADSLELFMEYGPLVSEEEAGFLAHFTILNDDYQPLEGSTVVLHISRDGETETIPFEAEDVPGIYHAVYTPVGEGNSIISVEAQFHGKSVVFDLDTVPVYHCDDEVPPAEESHGGLIAYTKEQAWKTDFSTKPVVRQPFNQVIKTSGQVLPARGDEVMIPATASGMVKSGNIDLMTGIRVQKNQLLFSIITSDLSEDNLQTQISLASTALEKATSDFKRAEELIRENIISQKQYLAAQTTLNEATTRYEALTHNVTSEGKQIFSPIAGFLKTVYVHEGDYVSTGQPLAMVSQNRRLVLRADVSPRYSSKLPGVVSASFKTLYNNEVHDIKELGGKLVSFGKSADNYTFYTPVFFEFDNRGELVPGSFTEVYLKLADSPKSLVIPMTALTDEAGILYVYVQEDGELFEKREVKIGDNDGSNVVILSGLKEGERIVTTGVIQVKMASLSSSIPHGHAH